jgi:hypothetical protein
MADFAAIAAVGKSIEGALNAAFAEHEPVPTSNTRALLATTSDFAAMEADHQGGAHALSIFLYRIDRTPRTAWSSAGVPEGREPPSLDLHYLLTAWADSAESEHRILGGAIQAIDATPILRGSLLDPSAQWAANQIVQLVIQEIPTETMIQLFEALPAKFRLSITYIARIARLEA